jgi:hypothetical protein
MRRPRRRIYWNGHSTSPRYAHERSTEPILTAPPRLSSRLTLLVRVSYVASVTAIAAGAVWALVSSPEASGAHYVLAALALAGGVLVSKYFSLVQIELDGDHLLVRGLFREWRIPVSRIEDVTVVHRGIYVPLGMGRITLTAQQPGLGAHVRFLAPTFSEAGEIEGALLAARDISRVGA